MPIFPAFPNRLELFSLVFALGIVAGGLAPLAMEQVRPTFGSTARLRELGLPVIGAITHANSALGNKRRVLSTSLFAAASAGLFLLYGGFIIVLTGMYKGIL